MVGSAVAMMVWSSAASSIDSMTPTMILRISAWLSVSARPGRSVSLVG
jgi:hypothetical protein